MNLLSEIFPSIYIGSGLNWNHFLSVILHWLALAWEPAYETNSPRKYTDITPDPVDFIVGSWWLHLGYRSGFSWRSDPGSVLFTVESGRCFVAVGSGFVFTWRSDPDSDPDTGHLPPDPKPSKKVFLLSYLTKILFIPLIQLLLP